MFSLVVFLSLPAGELVAPTLIPSLSNLPLSPLPGGVSWEPQITMSLLASSVSILYFLVLFHQQLPPCQPVSLYSDPSSDPYLRAVSPSVFPTSPPSSTPDANISSPGKKKCEDVTVCRPGILLPVWKPTEPGLGAKIARAVIYFVSLMYMFLGVSIIADRFMASIEVITSQVRYKCS